ncbi:MAG: hypothetical protein AAGN66_28995 [Acidobacteriota bacterium]
MTTDANEALREILRVSFESLYRQILAVEVSTFLAKHADLKDGTNRQLVVRNGFLPPRQIRTPVGSITVRRPRVRDKRVGTSKACPSIIPTYKRAGATRFMHSLVPWLYIKGKLEGTYRYVLPALIGPTAVDLPPRELQILEHQWQTTHSAWTKATYPTARSVGFTTVGLSEEFGDEDLWVLVATEQAGPTIVDIVPGHPWDRTIPTRWESRLSSWGIQGSLTSVQGHPRFRI